MTPGDYGCVRIFWLKKKILGYTISVPNFMGFLIRLFTWSHYDHVFIYIGDNQIIEANPSGVHIAELAKYNGDEIQWSQDSLSDTTRQQIIIEAKQYINTPYGFLDILYLGMATMGFKFNWLLRRVENQRQLICSQLVALCGESAGVDAWLCGKDNACLVTPGDLSKRAWLTGGPKIRNNITR